jgi:hypothetical protein
MSSYETCHHGKCTTYPGWNKCEKCEEELRDLLKEEREKNHGSKLYHLLRYVVHRLTP